MGKWTYRILLMLILVIAADVNCNGLMKRPTGATNVLTADLIFIALLVALFLIFKFKRRL
jgi:hypothetical protein